MIRVGSLETITSAFDLVERQARGNDVIGGRLRLYSSKSRKTVTPCGNPPPQHGSRGSWAEFFAQWGDRNSACVWRMLNDHKSQPPPRGASSCWRSRLGTSGERLSPPGSLRLCCSCRLEPRLNPSPIVGTSVAIRKRPARLRHGSNSRARAPRPE